MTKYLVVSTCNKRQWKEYGKKMIRSFLDNWPQEIEILFFPEGFSGLHAELCSASPWLREFKEKHTPPQYNGGNDGRDYRKDAVRFAHKIAAIDSAVSAIGDERYTLIWMDADIITHSPVTVEWLDSLFPEPAAVAWLDRVGTYPECSFLMFRMPQSKPALKHVVEMYTGGGIFRLQETHDSFVFQHVLSAEAKNGSFKIHSLSGNGRIHTGHPFVNSRLAECMDHLKGERRKERGMSFATDVKEPRDEKYWKEVRSA